MQRFKPRYGSHAELETPSLGAPFTRGLGSRRDNARLGMGQCKTLQGRKGVKGLLLVGLEKLPHGFELRTGDSDDIADGAGDWGRPAIPAQMTERNQEK